MTPTTDYTWSHGAVIRGPQDQKRLALHFTGGDFSDGTGVVLDALKEHRITGSFYFTGDYLRAPHNRRWIERALEEGHILGPHSDAHLLYCPWEDRNQTLVTRDEFLRDLERNIAGLRDLGVPEEAMRWWIPPYEWYNDEISAWAREAGHPLFNFTPGTLSHTDYTEDDAKNYRGNETIWDSIFEYEGTKENGLNGFLLLTHVGSSPRRTEKFFRRLGDLIEELKARGYGFVSVPEMLAGAEM